MTLKDKKLYFQVILATLIWGAAYPFTKFVITEISPFTLVTVRAFIGTIFLLWFSGARIKTSDFKPGFMGKLLLMSLLGVSAQQYTQAYALKYTLATNAGWLIALTPIIVVFLGLFAGEKVSLFKFSGFFSGFLGTLIIVSSRGGFKGGLAAGRGDLIFLISCFAWAFYVLLTKKWFASEKQARVTTLTMITALLTLLPVFLSGGYYRELYALTAKGWISVLYLSVLSSGMAYLFWNNSVEGLGPIKSSYFIYDEPFATIFSSYFFLGEMISPYVLLGGFFILLGVYAVNAGKDLFPDKKRILNGQI